MIKRVVIKLFFLIAVVILMISCEEDDTYNGKKSVDWTAATHESSSSPDYDMVFGDADGVEEDSETMTVKRMDITITRSNWNVMSRDMVRLYGVFGKDANSENSISIPEIDDVLAEINAEKTTWVPCTINFNNLSWTHVGIRFKGRLPSKNLWNKGIYKLPFELDFDVLEERYSEIQDQRFYGFDSINLSNGYLDKSYINEKIVSDIFNDAGVPAPRATFCRLYVDFGEGSKYFGLYTMIEGVETPFLVKNFTSGQGNLYEPKSKLSGEYIADEFVKKTNVDSSYDDVETLYHAINLSNGFSDIWEANIESVFNVDGFIRWLAVNTVIQNWFTYGKIEHNYYLYNSPADGLIHWIPVGNNMALMQTDVITPLGRTSALPVNFHNIGDDWQLIIKTMDSSKYWEKYINYVDNFTDDVFYLSRMEAISLEAHNLIQPFVTGAEGETADSTLVESVSEFEISLYTLNEHIETRYEKAKEFVFFENNNN